MFLSLPWVLYEELGYSGSITSLTGSLILTPPPPPLERAKRDPGTRWSRATLTIENIREGSSVIRQLVALGFVEFKVTCCATRMCCDRHFYPRWLIILGLQTAISNSIYSKLSKCVARQFTVIVWCCCRLTRCIYGKSVILQLWTSTSAISSRANCCFAFECARPILANFRQKRHYWQIHQHFRAHLSWVNLFALIISSTILAKFRHNRQIRKHFGVVAGLIYWLLPYCQQPFATLAKFAVFAKFANISGPF